MTIKYPKGETVWVTYLNKNHEPTHIITSKPTREYYYLYEVCESGALKKIGRAKSPIDFGQKNR